MTKRTPPPASFAVLLSRKEALQERWWKACHEFDKEANARVDALLPEFREAAIAEEKERAREWRIPWDQEGALLEEQLDKAAESLPLPVTTDWNLVYELSENYFSTQTNSGSYSKGLVEWEAEKLRRVGIDAQVRGSVKPPEFSQVAGFPCRRTIYYQVWAKTTTIGYAQLGYMPSPPQRDFLQFMWRRGLNPRVYRPHLPHGLEEKLGLDFYGNDISAPKVKK